MKVLLLTQWYPPEPCNLPADIARSLQEAGHDVQVLTGFPNYPSGEIYPGYMIRPCRREAIQGVPVTRVPLYPDHGVNKLKRGFNYLSFALSAIAGAALNRRPDVVFAVYPPVSVGLPAWLLSRWWNVPLVLYVMDVWPDELEAGGAVTNRFAVSAIARVAMWGYRRADRIIVITPGFRTNLIAKGLAPDTVETIVQMVDTDRYKEVERRQDVADKFGMAGRFNVMYAGNIGTAQLLDTVLDAAALLADVDSVRFILVGDGVDAARLRQRAEQMQLRNVSFLGRQPSESMDSLYAWADALLLLLRDDPVFRMTVPHKLLGYLASSKPVIGAVAGDAADVITSAGAGIVCPPGDPRALADAVMRMHDLPADERRRMADNGRRAALAYYDRHHQAELIANSLAAVVAERRGAPVRPATGNEKP
jgi:colanic acid biosynthesis glycosyl transferase WcaI